jgi:hypothetical protein
MVDFVDEAKGIFDLFNELITFENNYKYENLSFDGLKVFYDKIEKGLRSHEILAKVDGVDKKFIEVLGPFLESRLVTLSYITSSNKSFDKEEKTKYIDRFLDSPWAKKMKDKTYFNRVAEELETTSNFNDKIYDFLFNEDKSSIGVN